MASISHIAANAAKLSVREDAIGMRFEVHCSCCGEAFDAKSWSLLDYVGTQKVPAGDDPVADPAYSLILRNCTCGSTLALEVVE